MSEDYKLVVVKTDDSYSVSYDGEKFEVVPSFPSVIKIVAKYVSNYPRMFIEEPELIDLPDDEGEAISEVRKLALGKLEESALSAPHLEELTEHLD